MDVKAYTSVLDRILKVSRKLYKNNKVEKYISKNLSEKQSFYIKTLVDNAETQKSLIAVIITSLLKKKVEPSQDIRLHRGEFDGGYSGRTLDTNVVTPWLKNHFLRFAPKESGWLTRSIEQPHPFNKNFPGKIRNKDTKNAFLSILEDLEQNKANPESYLIAIVMKLLQKTSEENNMLSDATLEHSEASLTIDVIIDMLEEHFSMKRASRLPVVAIYTIYQLLLENVKIYRGKKLQPLKAHTVSDRHMGYADIEVVGMDEKPFEMVEVKHRIPIDKAMLFDTLGKIKDTSIKRYFILTTATPNFKGSKKIIFDIVRKIKVKFNKDVIPNGIIPSLKYYLRLVSDLREFLERYTKNLSNEFKQSSNVQELHVKRWQEIIQKHSMQAKNPSNQ
jgi:DNA (cytosine-5)-methyltransferase 1